MKKVSYRIISVVLLAHLFVAVPIQAAFRDYFTRKPLTPEKKKEKYLHEVEELRTGKGKWKKAAEVSGAITGGLTAIGLPATFYEVYKEEGKVRVIPEFLASVIALWGISTAIGVAIISGHRKSQIKKINEILQHYTPLLFEMRTPEQAAFILSAFKQDIDAMSLWIPIVQETFLQTPGLWEALAHLVFKKAPTEQEVELLKRDVGYRQ